MIPRRCYAILSGETEPVWWTTLNGRRYERRSGDRLQVDADDLTWVAHGFNDNDLRANFKSQALYQVSRKEAG